MDNKKIARFLTIFLRNLLNDLDDNKSLQKRSSTYLKDLTKSTLFLNINSYSYSDPNGMYLIAPTIPTNDKINVKSTVTNTFQSVSNGSLTYMQILQPNSKNNLANVQVWLSTEFYLDKESSYSSLDTLVVDNVQFKLSFDNLDGEIVKYNLVSYSQVNPLPSEPTSLSQGNTVADLITSLNNNGQILKMERYLNSQQKIPDATVKSIYKLIPDTSQPGVVTNGYVLGIDFLQYTDSSKKPQLQPHLGQYFLNFKEEYILLLIGNNSGITKVQKILFSPNPVTKQQISSEITYNTNNDIASIYQNAKEITYQPGYCFEVTPGMRLNYGQYTPCHVDLNKGCDSGPKYGNYLQNKPKQIKGIQIQDIKYIQPTSFKMLKTELGPKCNDRDRFVANPLSYPSTNYHNTIMELSDERTATSSSWLCGVWYGGYTLVSKIVFSIDSDNNVYVMIDSNYMSKNTLAYYGVGDNNQINTITNYTCLLNTYRQNLIVGSIEPEKQPEFISEDWYTEPKRQNIFDLTVKYVPVETTKRNLKGLKRRDWFDSLWDDAKHDYTVVKTAVENEIIKPVEKWWDKTPFYKKIMEGVFGLYKLAKAGPGGLGPELFTDSLNILGQDIGGKAGKDLETSSTVLGYIIMGMTGYGLIGDAAGGVAALDAASDSYFAFDIALSA